MNRGNEPEILKDDGPIRPVPLDLFLQYVYAYWMACVLVRMREDSRAGVELPNGIVVQTLKALWNKRGEIPTGDQRRSTFSYNEDEALLTIGLEELTKHVPVSVRPVKGKRDSPVAEFYYGKRFFLWTTGFTRQPAFEQWQKPEGSKETGSLLLKDLTDRPKCFKEWPEDFALQPSVPIEFCGAVVHGYEPGIFSIGLRTDATSIRLLKESAIHDRTTTVVGNAYFPPNKRAWWLKGRQIEVQIPSKPRKVPQISPPVTPTVGKTRNYAIAGALPAID